LAPGPAYDFGPFRARILRPAVRPGWAGLVYWRCSAFVLIPCMLASVIAAQMLGLAVRIRAGERQLTQALGAEYEQFAAARKRLLPGVW
jgi:protein-S-isoprenylcysteine O-methyltransferase Ste14